MKEFGIKELLHMYWSNKVILIVICIASLILGCVYSKFMKKPEYESSSEILFAKNMETIATADDMQNMISGNTIGNTTGNTTGNKTDTNQISNNITVENNNTDKDTIEFTEMLINTYIDLIKSDAVIDKVIGRLGDSNTESKEEIIKSIEVSRTSETSNILEIKVVNQNPTMAQSIAKNVTDVFLETIKDYYGMNNAYVITEAKEPSEPNNMNFKLDLLVFFVIGFALASIILILKTAYKNEE